MALPLIENRSTARSVGVKPGVFGKIAVKGLEDVERVIKGIRVSSDIGADPRYWGPVGCLRCGQRPRR